MTDIFQTNAKKLEELHDAIHRTVGDRNRSAADLEKWKRACAEFHSSYDALAFPGGIALHMARLGWRAPDAIEMTIQYLESDPRYFRSGYHKADMLKLLRAAEFDADQRKRMQTLILARVRGRPVREFRWYAKIAPRITDSEFEWRLNELAKSAPRTAVRHARWILDHIEQAKSVAKKRH